jgi:hypothetical protein
MRSWLLLNPQVLLAVASCHRPRAACAGEPAVRTTAANRHCHFGPRADGSASRLYRPQHRSPLEEPERL